MKRMMNQHAYFQNERFSALLEGDEQDVLRGCSISDIFESLSDTVRSDGKPMRDVEVVRFADKSITLKRLNETANLVARNLFIKLCKTGFNGHDNNHGEFLIGICIPPSIKRIVGLLAIMKLNAAYVPFETVLPGERVRYIVEETDLQCILTAETCTSFMRETNSNGDVMIFDYDDLLQEAKFAFLPSDNLTVEKFGEKHSDGLVCVLYTSGSTGSPKGVCLYSHNILNRLTWYWKDFPFTDNEMGVHKTSLLFVDSLSEILSCLLKGIPLLVLPKEVVVNPQTFLQVLDQHKVTRLVVVPSLLRAMLLYLSTQTQINLRRLKLVICSGEELPLDVIENFFNQFPRGPSLLNFYGSTETTGDVTYETYKSQSDISKNVVEGRASIGKPITNCNVYILDSNLKLLHENELGEIYISGLNVSGGYYKRGHMAGFQTNHLFDRPGHQFLYRTGDFARLVDGRIIYEGRQDMQVKIRGYRVNMVEIEKAIRQNSAVDKVVVITNTNQNMSELIAFCTPNGSAKLDANLVEEDCKRLLPAYMLPRVFKIDEIPLQQHTGKIDRQALREKFNDMFKRRERPNPPNSLSSERSAKDKVLDIICKELFIQPSQSIMGQNFFKIGGNSINAISTVVKLKKQGFNVAIDDFLRARDMEQILNLIDSSQNCGMNPSSRKKYPSKYKVEYLTMAPDREELIPLFTEAFVKKNPLDQLVGTTEREWRRLIASFWRELLADDLSLIVRDTETGRIVAGTIVLDIRTEIDPDFAMAAVGAINDDAEDPVKQRLLRSGGKYIDSVMNAVDVGIQDHESMQILHLMEESVIKVAKDRGYDGIITANSHPVTMNLDEHYFGYKIENSLHVKSYVYHGERPFYRAPEDYYIKVMVKYLHH
ncbi:unnamed protein product [Owenia fusiformis]|uniref:Uncharacterized protein n=1 Tax=Owenia fusiformis TaxID=6347 RepID=A0A8J1Y4F1_OWEFU|nr:unnamed protein product [Owenia fusiformis]